MLKRFATRGVLDAPWGVVLAPRHFGQFSNDRLIGRHILILDNIKPGDTISLDYSFGEQAPPAEVLKALENFDKALRREEGVFRRLRKSVFDAVAARRKFE